MLQKISKVPWPTKALKKSDLNKGWTGRCPVIYVNCLKPNPFGKKDFGIMYFVSKQSLLSNQKAKQTKNIQKPRSSPKRLTLWRCFSAAKLQLFDAPGRSCHGTGASSSSICTDARSIKGSGRARCFGLPGFAKWWLLIKGLSSGVFFAMLLFVCSRFLKKIQV